MRGAVFVSLGLGLLCVLCGPTPDAVAVPVPDAVAVPGAVSDEPSPELDNPLVLTVDRLEHAVAPGRVGLQKSAMLFDHKDLAAISSAAELEKGSQDLAVASMFLDGRSPARVSRSAALLFSSQQHVVAPGAAGSATPAEGQAPALPPAVVLGSLTGVGIVATILLRERTREGSHG